MRNLRNHGTVAFALAGTALLAGCAADQPGPSAANAAVTPSATTTSAATPGATAPSEPAAPGASAEYADGSYEATGTYGSGPSSIGVELTLVDGIVTTVEIETPATNQTSLEYQRLFAGGIGAVVVGRPLAELDVDNVAGSSSTVDGYNDAVTQIMQAAATP